MARIDRPQEQVLALSDIELDVLERLGRLKSASHSLVRRAHIILASAAGEEHVGRKSPLRLEPNDLPLARGDFIFSFRLQFDKNHK